MRTQKHIAPAESLFGFILFFIRKQWVKILLIQLFWLGWSIDQTFFPLLFGKIIDGFTHFSGDKSEAWAVLKWPIIAAIGLWASIEVTFRIGGVLMAFTFPKMNKQIRMYLFSHIQGQSHAFFSSHFAGNISTKISDMVDNVHHIVELFLNLFIPVVVAILIATVIFYQINPLFSLLLLGWALLHIAFAFKTASRCSHYSLIHAEARSELNGRIVDSLTNYFAVKCFANKHYELNYTGSVQRREQSLNKNMLIYIEKVRAVLGVLGFFGAGLFLNGYAYWCWLNDLITVGDIVIIFNTIWNIMSMLWSATLELPNVFREIGIVKQALFLLQEPITVVDVPHAPDLKVTKGDIQFQKVHFQYDNKASLFRNKSVKIHSGEKIGLVGYSGSGKTTFVNLILRLYDLHSGHILIDGQDIATVTQDSLRKSIALIPQDPALFHRSLMDNIHYGRPDASEKEVLEAAQKAHAHNFIMNFEHGYDTLVGERGVKLSGGQRQRVAIARAILKDAPILILDEATSALDSVTETGIQESLSNLMRGRTTIVIAHRLSTLLHMDRLLVFDQGKIVEEGTHAQLIEKKGVYQTLWRSQVGGFLPISPDDETL